MFFCKWFKKDEKLKFVAKFDALRDLMPPVKSKNIQVQWKVDQARKYNNYIKNNFVNSRLRYAFRCPGMTGVHTSGWILKTWQDVTISTNGDGKSFIWTTANNQKAIIGEDYITSHESENFHDIVTTFPHNTLKTIIKINTGWNCIIPDGYHLYQLPLTNFTENRFTAVSGIYTDKLKVADLNIPVMWHELNSNVFIPAGTPLCQLVLVKHNNVDDEIKTLSECNLYERTLIDTYRACMFNTFLLNYKNVEETIKNVKR